MKNIIPKQRIAAYAGICIAVIFSWLIMSHTLSYDTSRHEIKIATKLWSDFGAHIPLVRSFSHGANLSRLVTGQPIESPLYPGEPIRYHFGFYAIAGILERMGMRIDHAVNVPSAIGFALLLVFIFLLSNRLFSHMWVNFFSVLLFLFNGSLAFIPFFAHHPLSLRTPLDIAANSVFPAFGPWDGGNITAFWTLNIYTNQRHLALSYGLLLVLLFILYKPAGNLRRTGILTGTLAAFLLFINFAAAGIAAVFLVWIFLSQKKIRLPLLVSAGIGIIAYVLMNTVSSVSSGIAWQPGYLVHDTLTPYAFLNFWIENIGLHVILMPLGVLLAPRPVKRFIVPPLLVLFVLANLYRFSPDMINNHKLFNFVFILGNMFTAHAAVRILALYEKIPKGYLKKPLQLMTGIVLILPLTLSGIIDFFPIMNDPKGGVADHAANPDALFIAQNTHPADIVANTTWFYHPASIAGRPLYSGYTYFTWSYGYDQASRELSLKRIYEAETAAAACSELVQARVSWVEMGPDPESYLNPNEDVWNSFPPAYVNPLNLLKIYKTDDICIHEAR